MLNIVIGFCRSQGRFKLGTLLELSARRKHIPGYNPLAARLVTTFEDAGRISSIHVCRSLTTSQSSLEECCSARPFISFLCPFFIFSNVIRKARWRTPNLGQKLEHCLLYRVLPRLHRVQSGNFPPLDLSSLSQKSDIGKRGTRREQTGGGGQKTVV